MRRGSRPTPLFAIHCLAKPGGAALRTETRPAHLEYLADFEADIFCGGALLDLEGAPMGSLLIVECQDRRAAYEFAAGDPYSQAGLFQSVAITPWRRLYPSGAGARAA